MRAARFRQAHPEPLFAIRPRLSRTAVHRTGDLRDDPDALAALWSRGRLLVVDDAGRAAVQAHGDGLRLDYADTRGQDAARPTDAVFLGRHEGSAYWAVRHPGSLTAASPRAVCGLRECGGVLDAADAELFTTAVALLNWHRDAGFCPACGGGTRSARGGWVRRCTACGREHFPRTDPAVICLVHDGADGVLLGRGASWPASRFSVLAGFVNAGEALEACVRREIREEVGITVRQIRYLASQPWPFPRSLMIGFAAIGDPGEVLVFADGEIAEARWFARGDVLAALDANPGAGFPGTAAEPVAGLALPGGASIARLMIETWARSPSGPP